MAQKLRFNVIKAESEWYQILFYHFLGGNDVKNVKHKREAFVWLVYFLFDGLIKTTELMINVVLMHFLWK